jgi:hypothetical protein
MPLRFSGKVRQVAVVGHPLFVPVQPAILSFKRPTLSLRAMTVELSDLCASIYWSSHATVHIFCPRGPST